MKIFVISRSLERNDKNDEVREKEEVFGLNLLDSVNALNNRDSDDQFG